MKEVTTQSLMATKQDYFSRTEELESLVIEIREHFTDRENSNATTESVDEHGVVNDDLQDLLMRLDDAMEHTIPYDEDDFAEGEEY